MKVSGIKTPFTTALELLFPLIAAGCGLYLVIVLRKIRGKALKKDSAKILYPECFNKADDETKEKDIDNITQLLRFMDEIRDEEIKRDLSSIIEIVKDPFNKATGKGFSAKTEARLNDIYLPSVVKLSKQYLILQDLKDKDEKVIKTMDNIKETLHTCSDIFKKAQKDEVESEIIDSEIESKVLLQVAAMNGHMEMTK